MAAPAVPTGTGSAPREPVRPAAARAARRRAVRRRAGLGLVVFGLAGLGLIVPALLIVGGVSLPGTGPNQAADPRTELLGTLEASRASVADAADAARGAGGALDSAGSAAGSAGGFTADLAGTLRGLAVALRTPILGATPFASIAGQFDRVADGAAELAADLDGVEASIGASSTDLASLATRLDRLEERIGRLSEALAGTMDGGLGTLRLLAMALLAWLAVPAGAALWLGTRWLRDGRPRRRPRPAAA